MHELLGHLAPRLAARDAAIAALCRRLGPRLGLRGEALLAVEAAALVANIGRLAADESPDEALDTLALAHPVIAARLLEPYPVLRGVADLVRHHHEAWDGSGFPDGLQGAELTPALRGLAAVSRYVELVSPADPALEPSSPAAALATLRGEAGTRLAPDTVRELAGALARDAAA